LKEAEFLRSKKLTIIILIITLTIPGVFMARESTASNLNDIIKVFINGQELESDVAPIIYHDRTMVPLRAIGEALGMEVEWDDVSRTVTIEGSALPVSSVGGGSQIQPISIRGQSIASSEDLKAVLKINNPNAPTQLADLYIEIGQIYGIRGDIAFCQAAKETGWWKYGNLVQPEQNNYCGLGATGSAATGEENLNGANSSRVWYKKGYHGAFFDSPATGVEAHIQHLYAYASKQPIPAGRTMVDPRFNLVSRGIASTWSDLNGRWAVPGNGYGQSILQNYYQKVLNVSSARVNAELKQIQGLYSSLNSEV